VTQSAPQRVPLCAYARPRHVARVWNGAVFTNQTLHTLRTQLLEQNTDREQRLSWAEEYEWVRLHQSTATWLAATMSTNEAADITGE